MNPVLFTEEIFKIKFLRLDLNFVQRLRLSLRSERKSIPTLHGKPQGFDFSFSSESFLEK